MDSGEGLFSNKKRLEPDHPHLRTRHAQWHHATPPRSLPFPASVTPWRKVQPWKANGDWLLGHVSPSHFSMLDFSCCYRWWRPTERQWFSLQSLGCRQLSAANKHISILTLLHRTTQLRQERQKGNPRTGKVICRGKTFACETHEHSYASNIFHD